MIASVAIHQALRQRLRSSIGCRTTSPRRRRVLIRGRCRHPDVLTTGRLPKRERPKSATASHEEPVKPPEVPTESRPVACRLRSANIAGRGARGHQSLGREPARRGPSPAVSVPAIHGALTSGKSVAYVLDCSGSMGEFGKLQLARAALLATLRNQPESVRFQLITYNSAARVLVPGGCVPATAANIESVGAKVLLQDAKGRSNHVEAVRVAIQSRPDVILVLTDAEDLALAQFRRLLASAGKPIAICVAKVTSSTVGTPQELR